jgi:hypothetical protein
MSLLKSIDRLKKLDSLIKKEFTGTAEEFAEKIGISRSMLMMNIPDTSDPPIPGITSPMYSGNSLTHLFRESSDPGIPGMV